MSPWFPGKQIVRCPRCGLIFYTGGTEGVDLYGHDYFAGGEYFDYLADKRVIQRNFSRQIPRLLRLAPRGRLLEVGSAYGFFLELAGAHWEVLGIEVSAQGVRHARETLGVPSLQADFLDLPDEPQAYDLICMWDTVEHLRYPVRYIEKAARWLKPGGALVMTTGDIGSLLARFRKQRWRLIHPPTHLFYFSEATLRSAVEKFTLRVTEVTHVGYSRSYRGMLHGIFALGKTAWLYRLFTLGGRLDFPVYLNLYDILLLVAVKPGGDRGAAGG